jgi:hypothetical protein
MSIRLSVRMYQRGCHWGGGGGFSWNSILETFTKICRETPNLVKSDKNIVHCTWRPKCLYIVDSCTKYFVARQLYKGNPFSRFHGNSTVSYSWQLFASQQQYKGNACCFQQCVHERATVLHYTYIAYLVKKNPIRECVMRHCVISLAEWRLLITYAPLSLPCLLYNWSILDRTSLIPGFWIE